MILKLLRSVIEFDQEVSPENLVLNFQKLRKAVEAGQLEWGRPDDEAIYRYCNGFFVEHFEMPSAHTVKDYFEGTNNVEAQDRLKYVAAERPYARTNYTHLLNSIKEEQTSLKLRVVLKEAQEILGKGLKDEKTGETVKGNEAAMFYVQRKAQQILSVDSNTQVFGDIRQEADIMIEEYEKAESDPASSYGVLCGITEIDNICKGIKPGELWLHAAFPSHLKTMFASNWSYNAVTKYRTNVVFISLEMTRPAMRRNAYSLHSANTKFAAQGFKPLDYRAIRDGQLTPEQKQFYKEIVCPDFKSNKNYGTYELVIPDRDWTMSDIRTQLELLNREFEVGLVVIDYGLLVHPETKRKSDSYVQEMNAIVTASKKMALHFNKGAKVPVLMLFQTNRNGKDEADKNDGIYQMSALTWANAAEKDADVITTTYLNKELRQQRRTKFTNLKNRDNPLFEPFEAYVEWEPRKIMSLQHAEPQGFNVDESAAYLEAMVI
jgi:replicative DNA helicase